MAITNQTTYQIKYYYNNNNNNNNYYYYYYYYYIQYLKLCCLSCLQYKNNVNALFSTDLKSSIDNMNQTKNTVLVKIVNKMRVIHHHPSSRRPTLLVVSDYAWIGFSSVTPSPASKEHSVGWIKERGNKSNYCKLFLPSFEVMIQMHKKWCMTLILLTVSTKTVFFMWFILSMLLFKSVENSALTLFLYCRHDRQHNFKLFLPSFEVMIQMHKKWVWGLYFCPGRCVLKWMLCHWQACLKKQTKKAYVQ